MKPWTREAQLEDWCPLLRGARRDFELVVPVVDRCLQRESITAVSVGSPAYPTR